MVAYLLVAELARLLVQSKRGAESTVYEHLIKQSFAPNGAHMRPLPGEAKALLPHTSKVSLFPAPYGFDTLKAFGMDEGFMTFLRDWLYQKASGANRSGGGSNGATTSHE